MDKKIIKGLIDEKLETIQEQFSIIKTYEGKIPVIEIDLVMANIRDTYELFLALQHENTGLEPHVPKPEPKSRESESIKQTPHPPSVDPEQDPEPETQTPELKTQHSEFKTQHSELNTQHSELNTQNSETRRASSILGFEPVTEEMPEPEPEPGSQPHPPAPAQPERHPKITFDLFSDGHAGTLADRFKTEKDQRIADQLRQNRVEDLRTTIGINDKFLFINELFDGNLRIYDEAVQKLNDTLSLAQADLLLLDLKIAYNWDSESPTVKKFVELARKKF